MRSRGPRPWKREALAQLAAHHLQLLGLELGLDAFRHDPNVELPTDGDQPSHDHRARTAGRQPRDERLVDLDDVDLHVWEVGERRVTGPEIVERDADTCVYWAGSSGRRNTLTEEVAMCIRKHRSDRSGRAPLPSLGRPPVAGRDERRRFWSAIAAGMSSEEAAVEAGVSQPVGAGWFRKTGGMPPAMFRSSGQPLSGRYLSLPEREEIALLRIQGQSMQEIGRRLGRAASTISRELRRNAATRGGELEHRATTAQWHAEQSARRPKPTKLALVLDARRVTMHSGVGSWAANPQKRRNKARSSSASASLTSERSYQMASSRARNRANGGQAGSPLAACRCRPGGDQQRASQSAPTVGPETSGSGGPDLRQTQRPPVQSDGVPWDRSRPVQRLH
jgi:hypothetical protein